MSSLRSARGGGKFSYLTRVAVAAVAAVVLLAAMLTGADETRAVAASPAVLRGSDAIIDLRRSQAFDAVVREVRGARSADDITSPEAAMAFGGATKIQAGDGAAGDQFGGSVAVSGDTIIVGANAIGGAIAGPGSAYVFVRGGSGWVLQQKLTAADGAAEDAFGTYVALSTDTAVVGAYSDTVGTNTSQGSAYVFVRNGTTWTQQQKLLASDGASFDIFGRRVAISGDTIAVTAAAKDITTTVDQGAAYIFVRSGTVWTQQQRLTAGDGTTSDYFGDSVALAGDTVIVGAPEEAPGLNIQQGSAYVFVRSGAAWTQQQKLTASDGTTYDYFGTSVAISGETVVIGTLQDLGANFQQGSAYVFIRSGSSWGQQQKLSASDGASNDLFGNSVAILGDTIVVGAAGDTNTANAGQGSAYAFGRTGSTWTQHQKLVATDGAANDNFGAGVALTATSAIVGSIGDTIGANQFQGSAYIFSPDVSISGRVTTPSGLGLRNAIVSLIDPFGVRRTATTSTFGLFSFDNVRIGETYIISVASKRYRFTPKSTSFDGNATNVDFIGLE